jgi:multiple sugar transport system substrate-binding protein
MRKSLTILASTLLLSLTMSACGNSSSTNSEDAGKSATSAKSDESNGKSQEAVTLKFMGWEASPLETKSVQNGLKMFMEKHPNIKVEYTPVPNAQYSSKLLTMLAGDAAPDVFFLGSTDYRSFQQRGVLLDLTPQFGAEFKLDDFIPSAARIMDIDGKVYGVSSCTVSPVFYYNKSIFDKAGIPYPPSDPAKAWSWQEFVDTAKRLTVKNGDKVTQYGAYGFENFYNTVSAIYSNKGNLFNENGTKMAINSPEVKEVLQSVLDLRKKEGVAPEAKMLENVGMKPAQMLQTGKIAMLVDGSWALQELAQMKFPVGVAALPKFQEASTHGQAHVHAAWAKTKHPKEAWELLKFLSSEEYQIQLIKEGLWMPNRKSLYTEEGVAKWYNDKVHPEGFKQLVPYFRDAKVYPFALIRQNKVNDIITEEMDKFWYSGQSVDKTVENIESRSNAELAK